jgi:hypothetical protein
VSIFPLFPGTSNPQKADQEDFEREVAARFGLVPNFFRSAPDAPYVVRELWTFAKAAYLDNPIPTLFKERLFAYLSRFCEVRYCITRHCGFLLGLGRAAGDPNAQVMTIDQVVRLLQRPVPTAERTEAALARLEAVATTIDWPSPETSHDEDLLTCATVLFLQPARAVRAKHVLRIALGGEKCESAWNKDPVFGVIGIQSGPRGRGFTVASMILGSRGWDADFGDDCEDPSRVFCTR